MNDMVQPSPETPPKIAALQKVNRTLITVIFPGAIWANGNRSGVNRVMVRDILHATKVRTPVICMDMEDNVYPESFVFEASEFHGRMQDEDVQVLLKELAKQLPEVESVGALSEEATVQIGAIVVRMKVINYRRNLDADPESVGYCFEDANDPFALPLDEVEHLAPQVFISFKPAEQQQVAVA